MTTEAPKTTSIAEYSKTEAALAELRHRFGSIVYDVATTDGFNDAKKARAEIRSTRTALEAKRKEIKAPALLRCKEIDTEAERITAELYALETPIDALIKKEEERKAAEKEALAKAETERIAGIRRRLDDMKQLPLTCISATAAVTQEAVDKLAAVEIDDSFKEFYGEAQDARFTALDQLRNMVIAKIAAEKAAWIVKAEQEAQAKARAEEATRLAAERAELDRRADEQRQRERAEQERVAEENRKAQERIAEQERESRERIAAQEKEAAGRRAAEDAELQRKRDELAAEQRAADERRQAEQAEIDRKARAEREAEEARQRQIEAEEADRQREIKRLADELLDADAALERFKTRFGHIAKYAPIVKAIDALAAKKPLKKAA